MHRRRTFCGLRALLRGFYLTKRAPQAKICGFRTVPRVISSYKMSAAGDFFRFQDATKVILPCKMSAAGDFFRFQDATKVILPCKMSAAGDFFRFQDATRGFYSICPWLPPWVGGSQGGSIFGLGGSRGEPTPKYPHLKISVAPPLGGGEPRGEHFRSWGAKGGAHVGIWERSMNTPILRGFYLTKRAPQVFFAFRTLLR